MRSSMNDIKNMRYIKKLFDSILKSVCDKYNLGRPELDIIAFLHTNNDMDVASDIVEHCGLSKANISQAVDRLIQKNLIVCETDSYDRRKHHLYLTENTAELVEDIEDALVFYRNILIGGLTDKELSVYTDISRRMCENAINYLEEK